ncbi:MAG: ferritin-like domain-containing protein [Vicinamibacteria bacterium]
MNNEQIIDSLNRMLSQEHACAIRYATHAAVVSGPYAEAVATRLKEIATDEQTHAEQLRDRIVGLGGTPTMDVRKEDLKPATTLDQIIDVNVDEEKDAIRSYTKILETLSPTNAILFQTIQTILRDEQEHLEELEALRVTE